MCPSTFRVPRLERLSSSRRSPSMSTSVSLADAHCHPQLDSLNLKQVKHLKARHVAVMGVGVGDWPRVEELAELAPDKVIPCFGVHPWEAHLYASRQFRGNVASVAGSGGSEEAGASTSAATILQQPLIQDWQPDLEARLQRFPQAIVGECGLDRAARIRGVGARTNYDHQWDLLLMHLETAVKLRRPVSMHCVQAYGHLQDWLRQADDASCPCRLMLHSYSGSPDMVAQLVAIGSKSALWIGGRLYFSFSLSPGAQASEKMLARIRAVPDDRLLLESDETSVCAMDDGLAAIAHTVAAAKGWSLQQTVQQSWENFRGFYEGHLPNAKPETTSSHSL